MPETASALNRSRERERESRQDSSDTDGSSRSRLSYGIGGGGSSKEEQESTNQTRCLTSKMKHQEPCNAATINRQSKLSKAIRSGGRGSIDRHRWDVICEEEIL